MNHQTEHTTSRISTVPTVVLVRALKRAKRNNSALTVLIAFTLRVRAREAAALHGLPAPRQLSTL